MLSKSQQKLINSLQNKKFRNKTGLFVVEGVKGVDEFIKSDFKLKELFATENLFNLPFQLVSEVELKKISNLKTPNKTLALFEIPESKGLLEEGLIVALDNLRDPGNLGTIIRLCDWFGVEQIICDEGTVDCYNPKVVQATMGSLTRVQIQYLDLAAYLEETSLPIYGAFMEGVNVYSTVLPEAAILVMGNEANGISSKIESKISLKLSIPSYGKQQTAESLNVATATAILLSEFRRTIGK